MNYDEESRQPVLTSHLRQNGPNRGKKHYDVVNDRPGQQRPRSDRRDNPRQANPRGPRPQRNPKPQGFCHDQLLQAHKGCKMVWSLLDGAILTGRLIDADRYSMVIEAEDGRELIFKHAISSVQILPKGN